MPSTNPWHSQGCTVLVTAGCGRVRANRLQVLAEREQSQAAERDFIKAAGGDSAAPFVMQV